ncbi:MAG: DMT family transporter [Chloroflexi bacterium]|nr:DMT family transporter [Chloroflexota bacterium]
MTRPAPSISTLALGAALVTVVLWASAFVGIRDLAGAYSPGSIALGRLAIGVVLLGALVWRRGWQPVGRRDLVLIVASGLLWFALYNLALNEAERHVDAGTASMLVNTGPIFIGLFAGLFLGEGLPRRLLAGLAVAFGGSVVIGLATSDAAAGAETSLLGIALCLVAALAYAAGVTLQKPATANVSATQLTWLACLIGGIACLPFTPGLVAETAALASSVDGPSKIGWLVYLGVFPTSIAFTTWTYALGRTNAGRLGVMTYLIPPVVVVMAWLLLGEVPPVLALAGGIACIGGVVIARSSPGRAPQQVTAVAVDSAA